MTRNPTNGYIVDSGKGGNGLIAIPNQFGFDCARIQRHQRCLTVRENVNRLAPISQTKILTSTFHNGCDLRLKDCRIRTHRNHQLPTWSHSQNSSTCAAFCFRAVCVPFELRWWKRKNNYRELEGTDLETSLTLAAELPATSKIKMNVRKSPPLNAKLKRNDENYEDFFLKHIIFYKEHIKQHYDYTEQVNLSLVSSVTKPLNSQPLQSVLNAKLKRNDENYEDFFLKHIIFYKEHIKQHYDYTEQVNLSLVSSVTKPLNSQPLQSL
ncbi:hypothetical protein J6590_055614 [Homalodisca vitripennis]|nr:hypothetical protein J6590_055614 [Homalodisca vitripennis]